MNQLLFVSAILFNFLLVGHLFQAGNAVTNVQSPDGKNYFSDFTRRHYLAAKHYCDQNGGMLPKVTSVEQQTWLTSEFASDGDFWLSVIVMPNNPMKWFDGSELTFTNWAPDQPDHSKPGTVRIVSRHPDGRWVTKMVTDASSLTVCEKVV